MRKRHIPFIDQICLSGLYFICACSYKETLNTVSLYLIAPFITLLCFLKYNFTTIRSYLTPLLCMFGWVAVSSLWAVYPEAASRQLHQILGVVMLIYVYYSLAKNKALVPYLYFSFVICYFAAWYYAHTNILTLIDLSEDRLNDSKLNANTLAYYTFYYTIATFICHQICSGKWKRIFLVLFYVAIPLTVYTAFLTASRQVFIIQIPLIGLCLLQKYFSLDTKSFLRLMVIVCIAFIGYKYVVDTMYEGSLLQRRNEIAIKEDTRIVLMKDAFNVGMSRFFTGVGAGNFMYYTEERNFSHCTYLELFANTGILGALLFIIPLFSFLKHQWRRYKLTNDKLYISFFIFGLIFFVDNFFYVFYPDMFLMAFLCLIMSHSEQYWKDLS